MLRRLQIGALVGLHFGISACAVHTQSCPRVPSDEKTEASKQAEPQTLPRELTVEMAKDGPMRIDGAATEIGTLAKDFARLTRETEFVDTVLWVEEGTDPKQVTTVFEALVRAGAPHLRYALRAAEVAPLLAPTATAPTVTAPATTAAEPEPVKDSNPENPNAAAEELALSANVLNEHDRAAVIQVQLKSIGLHVGGVPKDEVTRKSVLNLIERRFDDFRSCYPLTTELKKPASFGVDLYLGVEGGKVTVKDVRTQLGPAGFRQCMLSAFEKLDLPPLAKKPVMISYSVDFEPKASTAE